MMTRFEEILTGKRVLVTGHTGFKGAWLSEWLLKMGAQPSGLSIDVPTRPSVFEALNLARRMEHFEGDVRSQETVEKIFQKIRPEVVFHMAAQPLVRRSYDQPTFTFETNITGTVNVLEAVRRSASTKAVVIVTSDKVYENVGWEFAYRENDRLGGKDPYSASKACAEIVVASYEHSFFKGKSPVAIATARAGNVIGGGDWSEDRIIPDCVRAWSEGKAVVLRNPQSIRPWQHVLEPIAGYLTVAAELLKKNPLVISEAFNFGPLYANCRTVFELVATFEKYWPEAQRKEQHESSSTDKPEAEVLRVNCDKANRRLQWEPRLSFEQTVEMTARWYQAFFSQSSNMQELTRAQMDAFSSMA